MDTYSKDCRPSTGRRPYAEPINLRELRRQMTSAEMQLWSRLRGNRIDGFHFRRKEPVNGFVVDFYCHRARLVIEITKPDAIDRIPYYVDRSRSLAVTGLVSMTFNAGDILMRMNWVLVQIRGLLHHDAES